MGQQPGSGKAVAREERLGHAPCEADGLANGVVRPRDRCPDIAFRVVVSYSMGSLLAGLSSAFKSGDLG